MAIRWHHATKLIVPVAVDPFHHSRVHSKAEGLTTLRQMQAAAKTHQAADHFARPSISRT
eukprot:3813918-Amphidinium_carterae.3